MCELLALLKIGSEWSAFYRNQTAISSSTSRPAQAELYNAGIV